MDSIVRIYAEQIEPHTDTFSRLSHCLMQASVLSDVLLAMQSIHPLHTRACARRFLSHYMVHYYPEDVVGDTGDVARRVVQSAHALFHVHRNGATARAEPSVFLEAFGEYLTRFSEWQRWDKAKLASTYRDVYRLLSEIKVSSPVEIQEPVEALQRTLDNQTKQIFGPRAREVRLGDVQMESGGQELEQFVHRSVHEVYWEDMAAKLERNSFDALCSVIEHVKERMLALCTSPLKRDEVTAFLDVGFLRNVLHVGMAQAQVRSLLSYCLRFLRDYGQPCHDAELAALLATTESLYTADATTTSPIQPLVGVIREIARRIDELVAVVCEIARDADRPT